MNNKQFVLKAIENSSSWHNLLGVMGNCFGLTLDEQLATFNFYPNTIAAMKKQKWEQLGYEIDDHKCYSVNDFLYCNIENVTTTNSSNDIPLWYYDKSNEKEIIGCLKSKKFIQINCNTIDDAINSYCNNFKLETKNSNLQILFKSSLYDLLSSRVLKVNRNIDFSFKTLSLDEILTALVKLNEVVSPFLKTVKQISAKKGKCVNYTFDEQKTISYNQDENNIKELSDNVNSMSSNVQRERLERSFNGSDDYRRRGTVREDRGLLGNSSSISELRPSDRNGQGGNEMELDEGEQSSNDNRTLRGRADSRSSNDELYARPDGRGRATSKKTIKGNDDKRGHLQAATTRLVEICKRTIQRKSESNGGNSSGTSPQLTLFNNDNNKTAELDDNEPAVFLYNNFKNTLCDGSGFQNGKYRIYNFFLEHSKQKERVDFLKKEYGTGGSSFEFTDGTSGMSWHDSKGIQLTYNHEKIIIDYNKTAIILDLLIQNDMYLSKQETENFPVYLSEQNAKACREKFIDGVTSLVDNMDNLSAPLKEKYLEIRRNASWNFIEGYGNDDIKSTIFDFLKDYSSRNYDNARDAQVLLQEFKNYAPDLFRISVVSEHNRIKEYYKDEIVFMKLGDFYEAMGTDAEVTADLLSLVLTSRNDNGVKLPLVGFPSYSLNENVETLLKAQYSVAIAEPDDMFNYYIVETYVPAEKDVVINNDIEALTQDDISIEKEPPSEPRLVNIDDYNVSYDKKSLINTNSHRNFVTLNDDIVPMLLNDDITYIQLKAGESFMPLTIEKIGGGNIAIAHHYVQNGDLMCDPEIVYYLDKNKQELRPKSYQQDNMGIYNTVEKENGVDMVYEAELSKFTIDWFKNIKSQNYHPYEILLNYENDDMRLFFDENGNLVDIEGENKEKYCKESNIKLSPISDVLSNNQQDVELDTNNTTELDYQLGYGYLGNGLTFWNIKQIVDGDYKIIAHVSSDRKVTFYDENLPENIKDEIENKAKTLDLAISSTQDAPVFDTPVEEEQNEIGNYDAYIGKSFVKDGKTYIIKDINESRITLDEKITDPTEKLIFAGGKHTEGFVDDYKEQLKSIELDTVNSKEETNQVDTSFDEIQQENLLANVVGKTITLDDRLFQIDDINILSSKATLRDITFENAKGFPIDRVENLDVVRKALLQQSNEPKIDSQVENTNFDLLEHPIENVGKKEKYRRNIEAINVLKQCEFENRNATPEEQLTLSKYVGWGGLSEAFDEKNTAWSNEFVELYTVLSPEEYSAARESTLTAFYTPTFVVSSIYKALTNFGLKQGNILEPSCGVGNFLGMMPKELRDTINLNGVELDEISGKIAKLLYPKANIQIKGYEQTTYDDNSFDAVIGNIPFGSFSVNDKQYNDKHFLIHDYFFAKSLDKVKPGGIIAFITSKGTMDKKNPSFRKYIAKRAELVGAIRLPDDTFKRNAGTEVTSDIIFLKKRENEIEIEPDWVYVSTDDNCIEMNEYFINNPSMVLGTMQQITTAHGFDFACKSNGEDVSELLNNAIDNLHTTLELTLSIDDYVNSNETVITPPIPAGLKDRAFCNIDDVVYQRIGSNLVVADVKDSQIDIIKDLIVLRDSCYELMDVQTTPILDDDVKPYQDKLNSVYDNFVSKYGNLNTRKVDNAFRNDPSYPLLIALENYDEEGKFVGKSDMFYKRTIRPVKHITKCDTSTDALITCLSEKGKVDIDYIKTLTNFGEEQILDDLKGVIFRLPDMNDETNKYVTADEYLSGNVKDKLALAKVYKQVKEQTWVDENIEALEQVQPEPLNASKIKVRLGATWIPNDIIDEFMYHLLNTSYSNRNYIKANYIDLLGKWVIENRGWESYSTSARSVYGTARANGYDLFEDCLNLKNTEIRDLVTVDGKDKYVTNDEETRKAQAKQNLIRKEFENWIWKDQNRRKRLEDIYNNKFNSNVVRKYDGSYLTFGGANCNIEFRPHQKNAIARILQGKNVLLDHCVGAGKTFVMIAAAMESKRIGLCHKSIITVPNNIVGQVASDFMFLYPNANILMTTEKDFTKGNRKKFCSRIATGDFDAIIMGHSQFEKIPLSKETQIKMLQDQLDDVVNGIIEESKFGKGTLTVKALERSKKSIQLRLDKLNDIEQDDVVTFEQLGVDKIFVDEAHNFKNLFLYTKMGNVAGINTTESKKATDMYNKVRYLDEVTGGRGTVFATGTPISNTMAELYTMQKYLQYDRLNELGLLNFDSWASTFGETITELELKPEGTGFRMKERFSKFFNVPELMSIFREVADIQTKEMIKLPVPKVNYENISCPASDYQYDMVQELGERADAIRNGTVDRSQDNMLLITSDGRKLALDQRIINPDLPDFENSKVNICVDNVSEIYQKTTEQKGTQLIFCDLSTPTSSGFNVYDDIKTKLIDKGIPEDEIAFVHDAKTNKAKEKLFKKVRTGSVRVLLGSTSKCGTGTNVQERLVATHDLDCPWRPADLEQRAGRIERQGNLNKEVSIYRYVTENTFDAYMYQLVEKKQRFISQVMLGDTTIRELEDLDEASLSYAKLKALAVGDPLIQEKMELDLQVRDLLIQKQNHNAEIFALEDDISFNIPKKISVKKGILDNIKTDLKNSENENLELICHGTKFTNSTDIGTYISSIKSQLVGAKEPVEIGTFKGLPIKLFFDNFSKGIMANIGFSIKSYRLGLEKSHIGEKLLTCTDSLLEQMVEVEREIDVLQNSLSVAKESVAKEFPLQDELDKKQARLDELDNIFNNREDKKEQKNINLER